MKIINEKKIDELFKLVNLKAVVPKLVMIGYNNDYFNNNNLFKSFIYLNSENNFHFFPYLYMDYQEIILEIISNNNYPYL